MTSLPFFKHGERVRIEYAPQPGFAEGAMGRSTDSDRSEGHVAGVVTRFKKRVRVAQTALGLGWIKATYPDAIEYTGMTKEQRGQGFLLAVLGGAIGLGVGTHLLWDLLVGDDWFVQTLEVFTGPMFIAFAVWIIGFGTRIDLFKPTDLPIIFDRKHRKVYRILRQEMPGRWSMFKHWPVMASEFDWDLIDAEHQAEMVATGSTVGRNHFLMFLVRKSADDPTIIDSFQIANANVLGELLVAPVWEHIRRFMEEGGPHLPSPDEPLADLEAPSSWWQSLGATGLIGPGYFDRWAKMPVIMAFMHLLFPLTLPMFLLWGTGNWLSYKTALPVSWPEEVLHRIGKPTRQGKA